MTIVAVPVWAAPRAVCAPPAPPLAADLATAPPQGLPFPTFCAIPATPKNIRSAQAFKAAVMSARVAGAELVRQTALDTFSLTGTESFAAGAAREAAPPPPMSAPGDTEAFIARSKAKATPPPRPH